MEAYFGNGDGTFQQGVEISSLPWIASCAIADFNLDGIPDLVVSDGEFVAILHGLGKRQFSAPVPYSVNVGPGQPHIADVNNDGSPDVIVGSYLAGAEGADPQAAAVGGGSAAVVMLNRGGDKGSITTDPNPAVYGQTNLAIVALVAETVPGSGVPSGDVSLSLDGVSLGSFPLVNGSASATSERSLNAGQHSVSGHYPGDGNFNPKDFSGTVTVQQATTSVSLNTAPSVIVVGQGLTLTSVVAPEFYRYSNGQRHV